MGIASSKPSKYCNTGIKAKPCYQFSNLLHADCKVSLFWINRVGKEWKPFVQNRIRKLATKKWNTVGEKITQQMAILSRGVTVNELAGSTVPPGAMV